MLVCSEGLDEAWAESELRINLSDPDLKDDALIEAIAEWFARFVEDQEVEREHGD